MPGIELNLNNLTTDQQVLALTLNVQGLEKLVLSLQAQLEATEARLSLTEEDLNLLRLFGGFW